MRKLLNLPAYTEGQPETIVRDIEDMVRSYVEKVNKVPLEFCFLNVMGFNCMH